MKGRVKDLEEELKTRNNATLLPTPPPFSTISPTTRLDPMEEHGEKQGLWEGVWTTGSEAHQTQFSGPSSSSFFLTRLSSHISLTLDLSHLENHIQPNTASNVFASPTSSRKNDSEEYQITSEDHMVCENLSKGQEEYFLGLFWQSYYCTTPIIDEAEFTEHYESLWVTSSGATRKPSPLVDIVLALCMQHGMAFIPRNDPTQAFRADIDSDDSTIAGREFYRRCQMLLSSKLETPSITTLQCHIFSAIYLRDASYLNMAHNTLAMAIRTAHTIGLHLESPDSFTRAQKETRRRLWWMVYVLESKACMALGRPWSAQISQVNCNLPSDDREIAQLSSPSFASSIEDVTWLSYHVHSIRLVLAARAVQAAFESKCAQVLSASNEKSFYGNPKNLETLAGFLSQSLQCVRNWVEKVPERLKTKRRAGGEPFSTDRSALELDLVAPLWLQRQRLLLELLYHNLIMNLYRPFICFSNSPGSSTPLADGNSISCLNHAIASTNIILQILKETDILNGWHEAYQFQWNATLSMVGFIFAKPICHSTPTARKTIDSAIAVFDIFRNNFAVAASATHVTRDLAAKADAFIDCFRTGSYPSQQQPRIPLPVSNNLNSNNVGLPSGEDLPRMDLDDPHVWSPNLLSGTMGAGFPIDSFSGFEWSFSEGNSINPEIWPQLTTE